MRLPSGIPNANHVTHEIYMHAEGACRRWYTYKKYTWCEERVSWILIRKSWEDFVSIPPRYTVSLSFFFFLFLLFFSFLLRSINEHVLWPGSQPFSILAFVFGQLGRECIICHETSCAIVVYLFSNLEKLSHSSTPPPPHHHHHYPSVLTQSLSF